MNRIIKSIPNTITSANLFCGTMATYYSAHGEFQTAFWFIIGAVIFDFFDGFAARMLKAYSPIGKELDSLADMVGFGVAPAMALFTLTINNNGGAETPLYSYIAFTLAIFAALRLAKFNVDTRQSEEFRGLPTPAMSLFFFSWVLTYDSLIESPQMATCVTLTLAIIFSALMVCDIRMFSFKFKSFSFAKNMLRYFFAIFAVIVVIFAGFAAPAIIIAGYVVVSLIRAIMIRGTQQS